jgi:hypothetical protein
MRLINKNLYVSPNLSKSHITLLENCLYWILSMRSSALNIKAVSWKKKIGVLWVYQNESLYVDNPEDEYKLVLTKRWHAVWQLCIFWLHLYLICLFIYYLLFEYLKILSVARSKENIGKYFLA